MTAIKTNIVAPKVAEKIPDLPEAPQTAEATSAPQDAFTVSDLVKTLADMKELQEKTQRGEIKLDDAGLLADLEFHIHELSDTLSHLNSSAKK